MDKSVIGEKRDNSFNIWRVVFTFVILLFHLSNQYYDFYKDYPFLYYHWYVAVEFFFMLSGYLMATHATKHPGESAFIYSAGRIRRLYPEYILVLIISIFFVSFQNGVGLVTYTLDNWEEIFMFQSIGTGKFPYVNNPAWYVSSMFIAGHFIYYLLQQHKKLFLEFLGPVLIIISLGYFYKYQDSLQGFYGTSPYGVSYGVLRAIIGLSLGIYIYYLSNWYQKNKSHINHIILVLIEVLSFAFVLVFSITHKNQTYDFQFIFISAIGVFCSSMNNAWTKICYSKIVLFLCKISYMMFLSHFLVLRLMELIWPGQQWRWIIVPIYIIMTVGLSVVLYGIKEIIVRAISCRNK